MIVTLTPNPSVDRTVFLSDLAIGSVNRSQRSWSEPSGKGVNVALALHAHGVPARAIVTAGGPVGAQLQQMLSTSGLDTVIVDQRSRKQSGCNQLAGVCWQSAHRRS
jgi:1-phosphofructokinase